MSLAVVSESQLWTVHDVARFIKMSPSWVYKAVERNRLPHLRFGSKVRFDPDVIRRLRGTSGDDSKE